MKNHVSKSKVERKEKVSLNLEVLSKKKEEKGKLTKLVSIVLMILIILQPIMDAVTYLQIRYSFNFISLSSIIRTVTLGLMLLCLLVIKRRRKEILFLIGYFIIYLTSQIFLLHNGFSSSLNTILTIFYLPIVIIFMHEVDINESYFNLKIIMITYLIYLNLIVIPYLFKYGNYADNFYEGKNGFYGLFYGGNEISNILVILLPLVIEYLVRKKSYFLIILTFVELLLCIYLVGTKTLMLGSIIVSIYFLFKYLRPVYKKFSKKKKGILWGLAFLIFLGILVVLPRMAVTKNLIRAIEYYDFNLSNIFSLNGLDKLIFSGRLEVLKSVGNLYRNSSLFSILLGLGKSYIILFKGIEIDIFDIFFTLGISGILVYGYVMLKNIKSEKLKGVYLFTFILSMVISLITGHVLNTPNVSIFIGLLFSLNKLEE